MPDLTLPILLLVAGGAMLVAMWRMGIFTPRAVVAWTRIGRYHHLTDDRPLDERLADRVPSMARFFRETSVPRLLAIANRREGLNTWLVKVAVYVLLVGAALTALDFFASVSQGTLPVPPLFCLVLAGLFAPLSYLALRREARGVKGWVEVGPPDEQGGRAIANVEEVRATGQRRLRFYLERSPDGWLIVRVEKGAEQSPAQRSA